MTASACGLSSQIRYVTDPPASGEVLYSDDFSARGSWDTWSDDSSIVDYSTGGLRFFINQTGYDYWSIVDEYFLDTTIDVDVTKINGPDDNRFGVLCRYQDEKNYYQVSLKNNQFAIGMVVDGKLTPLTEPYWKDSQFIGADGLPGGANVTVTCQGSSIGLSIEGMGEIPLLSDPENHFQHGKVALFAAPAENITDEFYSFVAFNNLTIEIIQ